MYSELLLRLLLSSFLLPGFFLSKTSLLLGVPVVKKFFCGSYIEDLIWLLPIVLRFLIDYLASPCYFFSQGLLVRNVIEQLSSLSSLL